MKSALLLIVLSLMHCSWLYGQTGYSIRQYTAENGLPQNSIKSIAADSAGYIWLATEDGLVRFDGYHFAVFNSANLGVKNNHVYSIRQSFRTVGNRTAGQGAERAQVLYARFGSEMAGRIENGRVKIDSLYHRNRANRLSTPQVGVKDLNEVIFIVGVPDLLHTYPRGNDQHMIMAGNGEGNFFMVEKSRIRYYADWQKQYECKSPGQLLWNYFSIGGRLYYRHGDGVYSEISGKAPSIFKLEGSLGKTGGKEGRNEKFFWNGNSEQAFLYRDHNLYIFDQHDDGKLYLPSGGVILDKVEADRKELKAKGDTIAIPDNVENIKLFLSTPYFGHISNLDLSYAIVRQGQVIDSSKWVPLADGDLEIQISALRSGEYTLWVKKHDGFGLKNISIQSFLLVFPQKWYENIWLITALMILLIAAAVWVTHSYNRRKLRTMMIKNIQLEEDVATRTDKLSQTLIGLEASRKDTDEQIHWLSRLVASISHDVQSPLRYISFASKKIPEMIQTEELAEASKVGTMIFDLSEHMSTMLEQIIDFTKIQVYGKKTHLQNVDVHRLVEEKYQLFAGKIQINNSIFENKIPGGLTIAADYQLLSIIVHNLLDNAAKYTTGGRIWVSSDLVDEKTPEIVIANSAGNIPDQIVEIINSSDRDRNLGELIDEGKIRGIGLIIVKEIAAIANISVSVSQTNQTYFHLRFPLSPSVP